MSSKRLKTAEESAVKWESNSVHAEEEFERGVRAVVVNPAAEAAKNADKMLRNLTASVKSGKWAARLNSVTKEAWIEATAVKGKANYSPGIRAASMKYKTAMTKLLAYQATIRPIIDAMPNDTITDAGNRAKEWVIKMGGYKTTGGA